MKLSGCKWPKYSLAKRMVGGGQVDLIFRVTACVWMTDTNCNSYFIRVPIKQDLETLAKENKAHCGKIKVLVLCQALCYMGV